MGYPPQHGPPPKGETGRGLAVIALTAAGLLIGAVVIVLTVLNPPPAAPNSPPASSASGAPRTEESVRQAARTAFDAYASGASGEFWDLWSPQSQTLITRDEYVRLFQLCPPLFPGAAFTVTDVSITGETALVTATRAGDPAAYDYDFTREGGSWRYVLPPQEEAEYRSKGVDEIVLARRAAGTCGTSTASPSPGAAPPLPGATPPTPGATPPTPGMTSPAPAPTPVATPPG
ncbi:nuclear transport factor 2 family protein [Planomonospora venezuelensis]|uniref:Uncharacterized protein n=1 Tax=Planomonospora venezuelensis TaxID=1999 RepID=A0A841CVN3_PLAVE|nr:nuclear transport factor 2 family protein [Planomonospora venezuelensis]MBB5960893.1 hypothetical protein [Planomonospora venezuelensis]GIN01128.1 hypothetical protein Pve01_27860 [Planomonospora venezuelensis]